MTMHMAGVLTPKKYCAKVLEKAYAKLYGFFQNIDGGFVSYTLSDLTGGLPETITFKIIKTNWKDYGIFYMNMIGWVS